MSNKTKIEWTDATVNFWWGCTKVGPGCDHCYAETLDARFGPSHWGTDTPRRQIASAANTLAKLNRQGGKRVFIQSMSDLFDNEVPGEWFDAAWMHIHNSTECRIQIVTKRISRVEKAISESGPPIWPQHAGLMITVVNQAEADRDIPRLLALKAKLGIPWVGLSMEPLLGPVDLTNIPGQKIAQNITIIQDALRGHNGIGHNTPRLDWVITGGESGPKARPMHPDWARSLRDQCDAAGVPFFFKQWGEWADCTDAPHRFSAEDYIFTAQGKVLGAGHYRHGGMVEPEWRQKGGAWMSRAGKSRAGRLLDGREWNAMPGR